MKKSTMSLTILLVIFLTSCSLSANNPASESATGIRIINMVTASGSSEISYDLTLFNAEPVDVVIHWIEPILSEDMSQRVLTTDRRVIVEKTLASNTNLKISGRITFDAGGASKVQIASWEPFFTGFTVSSEQILLFPSQAGK
jgi:hypothetical protein